MALMYSLEVCGLLDIGLSCGLNPSHIGYWIILWVKSSHLSVVLSQG